MSLLVLDITMEELDSTEMRKLTQELHELLVSKGIYVEEIHWNLI